MSNKVIKEMGLIPWYEEGKLVKKYYTWKISLNVTPWTIRFTRANLLLDIRQWLQEEKTMTSWRWVSSAHTKEDLGQRSLQDHVFIRYREEEKEDIILFKFAWSDYNI